MGRPPLPVGGHGDIHAREVSPKWWKARCYVRDLDGHRREVTRWDRTKTGAVDAVQRALKDRPGFAESDIGPDSTVETVARAWMELVEREVADGAKSSDTARTYRSTLDNHVLPAMGALRCREATLTRVEGLLMAKAQAGVSGAQRKTIKSVLSGVLGHAARHGAIPANPVRDTSRVVARAKKEPRAMTADEIMTWLRFLDGDKHARAHDLADLTAMMLATGTRISEMLAVRTQDVDLDAATVVVSHRIKRLKGEGLVRTPRRGSKGKAVTLALPQWAVSVCRRRILALGGDGPLFPTVSGNWRDPTNTGHAFSRARDHENVGMEWLTPHVFRKTVATLLDQGGLSARLIADQLVHAKPSMTQDKYMGRNVVGTEAAEVLERHDPTKWRDQRESGSA